MSVGHPLQRQVFHWNCTNKEWDFLQDMMPMDNLPMLQLRYTTLWEIFRLLLLNFLDTRQCTFPPKHRFLIAHGCQSEYTACPENNNKDDDIDPNLTSIQLKKPERINTKIVWLDVTVLRLPPVIYTHVYLFKHR